MYVHFNFSCYNGHINRGRDHSGSVHKGFVSFTSSLHQFPASVNLEGIMEIKMYKAFKTKQNKISYHKPAVFMTLKQLIDTVYTSKSYEQMYFVYPESIKDLIDPALWERFKIVTREMFDRNPDQFGILIYKDKLGNSIYE